MYDKLETEGNTKFQHGKFNNRIYVMRLARDDVADTISKFNELANKRDYTKIFAKIRAELLPHFLSDGFVVEAFIPKLFKNKTDGLLVSKFLDKKRELVPRDELYAFYDLLHSTEKSKKLKYKHSLKYIINRLGIKNIKSITAIFKQVFETYPFPIHEAEYILETMKKGSTQYYGVWDGKKLIGVSTAEIDLNNKNAELTDFAVLPEYRGQNLAFRLLMNMEREMKFANIKTCYTIARLNEPGMNKTFLKSGYKYSGTLINNTNIAGNIESMNIFYKHL